ncbi:MAG: diguanylate cyclase [Sutterellaceae bacterium]|nr:diguanylate cyclase [Burkholderiaceae bacterium]MDW8430544.1 diguanylate cyclase [Sutterellaceae bacterium]
MCALLGGAGAWTAAASGSGVFIWLAVFWLNLALRALVALRCRGRALPPWGWPAYLVSHAIDWALWAVLVAMLLPVAAPAGSLVASGTAALLQALLFGGRAQLRGPFAAAWAGLAGALALRAGLSTALAFGGWLLAVWWLGMRRGPAEAGPAVAAASRTPPSRLGWKTAIGVLPNPVLLVRHSRITDLNAAAAAAFGREASTLIGRRVQDCLQVEPTVALDPMRAARHRSGVTVRPILAGADARAWSAQVRVLEPGRASSTIVIVLLQPQEAANGLPDEARRFAAGVGGLRGESWYRDEAGRLFLPAWLPPRKDVADRGAFPLAHCTASRDQARASTVWQAARTTGAPFDERLSLIDVHGKSHTVRVVAVARGVDAVVGAIVPVREAPAGATMLTELAQQLPALIWLVDPTGRVVYASAREDPSRWGMLRSVNERPLWFEAFALRNGARVDVQTALQNAARGCPTFDLINSRTTANGGRIVVRSYFVPFAGEPPPGFSTAGTLVLDTIASPQQLSEIDRLRRSKAQYRALVEASTSLIWACDAQLHFTFVSRRAAREIYGYAPEELIGQPLATLFLSQPHQAEYQQALAQLRSGKPLRDVEMVHVAKNGSRRIVSVSAVALHSSDGAFAGAIGMNADLTVLKLRERRLIEALRVERTVLDAAGQALAVVKDGLVTRCNEAFLGLLQADPSTLARTPLADYFAAANTWEAIAAAADAARTQDRAATQEVQVRRGSRASGQTVAWCQVTVRAVAPGEYVVVLTDIDHIRQREEEALHDAHHDELTGLANRRLLAARAASAFAAAALRNSRCALFVIDLDDFKQINDRFGHDVGDRVLREVAVRLTRAMRPHDTVARRGGDEFAVLVADAGQHVDTERIAQRLLAAIAQPLQLPHGPTTALSASVGIALVPEHGWDLEQLLQRADLAMYKAKQGGKNRYAFAEEAAGPAGASALHGRRGGAAA